MLDFVFSVPWWTIVALVGIGTGVLAYYNRRLNRRGQRIGIAILAFAIIWAVVSYLIVTDLEKTIAGTRQLVRAVLAQDAPAIRSLLAADAIAGGWDREEIVSGAVYYAKETGLTAVRILSVEPSRQGAAILVTLGVLSEHGQASAYSGLNLGSTWELEWRRAGDQWLVRTITPIQIGPVTRDEVERCYLDRPVPKR